MKQSHRPTWGHDWEAVERAAAADRAAVAADRARAAMGDSR